jgi:hypothetical protein
MGQQQSGPKQGAGMSGMYGGATPSMGGAIGPYRPGPANPFAGGQGAPQNTMDPTMLSHMLEMQKQKSAALQSGGQNPNQMMNNPGSMMTTGLWKGPPPSAMGPYHQSMLMR